MTNLINQLQFEVNCSGEDQAFHVRHSFPDTLQEQIIRTVEEVCAHHVAEDEWIQIDKIEINAGSYSLHSLYTDFEILFRQKFEEELLTKLSDVQRDKRKSSRRLSWLALFFHFLEKGTMPWWAMESEIDLDEISTELLAIHPGALQQFLYDKKFQQVIWTRASCQLNNKTKTAIVSFFETLVKTKEQFVIWTRRINDKTHGLIQSSATDIESIIDRVLIKNAPLIFSSTEIDRAITLQRLFTDNIDRLVTIDADISPAELTGIIREITGEKKYSEWVEPDEQSLIISKFLNKEQPGPEQAIKHTVKEAGIVLLAGFLPQLFGKLGLYDKSGWSNSEAAWRAVHLVKFLATGQQQMPEYTMVLEKLLCGLPLEQPLPIDIDLTEEELSEADLLLQSVLEHWKALRSTSLKGLRETFFRRDGLLTRKENDWVVQVERKTLDVLLDSLPWGYSAVRLPWNEYVIYTEW